MSYSQNNEEEIIRSFFGDIPQRFLDIGAYDPANYSNVRALAERGWSGVLVEPAPAQFLELAKYYGKDDRFTLINAAVHPLGGLRTFHHTAYWASTLSDEHVARSPGHDFSLKYLVPTITMEQLVPYGPYQFINIDAEGLDFELASLLPFSMHDSCRMLCVEHAHKTIEEWMSILASWGFFFHTQTPENRIFIKP